MYRVRSEGGCKKALYRAIVGGGGLNFHTGLVVHLGCASSGSAFKKFGGANDRDVGLLTSYLNGTHPHGVTITLLRAYKSLSDWEPVEEKLTTLNSLVEAAATAGYAKFADDADAYSDEERATHGNLFCCNTMAADAELVLYGSLGPLLTWEKIANGNGCHQDPMLLFPQCPE